MYEPRESCVQSNQLETVDLTFIGYLKTRGEKVMAHSSHINFSENTYILFHHPQNRLPCGSDITCSCSIGLLGREGLATLNHAPPDPPPQFPLLCWEGSVHCHVFRRYYKKR